MKKRTGLVTLIICVLTLCFLGGCGKVTAKSVLDESQKNAEKVESYTGNANMAMALSFAQSGVSMKIEMSADMDMEVTQDVIHAKGNLDIGILGLSLDLEGYVQDGDKEATLYLKIADEWTKIAIPKDDTKTEDAKDKVISANDSFYKDIDEEKIVLQKETEKFNEKDVYVINTTLDSEVIGKLIEKAKDMVKDTANPELADVYEQLDFSKVKMELESKIYKKEKLPAAFTLKWTEGLNELFASAMGDAASDVEIKMEDFTIEVSYDQYDAVEKIEIPQEALDAQEKEETDIADSLLDDIEGGTGDSLLGDLETGDDEDAADVSDEALEADADGYYTLISWDEEAQVKVKAPEDLELDEVSSNDYLSFSFYNDDISKSVTFGLETSQESDISYNENYFEERKDYYEESESITDYTTAGKKELKAGDAKIEFVSCSYKGYGNEFQEARAWMVLGNGYMVECDISTAAIDTDGLPDLEDMIVNVFEGIKGEAA